MAPFRFRAEGAVRYDPQADGVVRVGGLFRLAATWLGLGAMVVAGRRYVDLRGGAG